VYDRGRLDNLPLLKLAEADLVLAEGDGDAAAKLALEVRDLASRSAARYLNPTALRLEGRSVAAGHAYNEVGMAVHSAVALLDAVEQTGADPSLLDRAREPLERAGFHRQLNRLSRLQR
jgi:hypothetical protein